MVVAVLGVNAIGSSPSLIVSSDTGWIDRSRFYPPEIWFAVVGTIAAFDRVDRRAAALLGPYLAWVTFAAALNYAIYAG